MAKAYVLMSCNLGYEKSLISELKSIENVKEVHGTLGLYDIIAKLEADSDEKIKQTITEKIRKVEKIGSTMTLMKVAGEELFKANREKLMGSLLGKNDAQAYIVIHCEQGKEDLVLRDLNEIPEVKEADVVYGNYDVVGKIEAENHKELEKIITKKIRKLKFIRTTMTLNVVKEQE
ncbi:MAG: Lrp/AsnC ligand binding domain-containing protein [Nitrosopumilaceae archaeon]